MLPTGYHPQQSHTGSPTHIETRTHDRCGDKIEKSQAPDDGRINVRNVLSIEEVKYNLIASDIKLVCYSSTINFVFETNLSSAIFVRVSFKCHKIRYLPSV